MSSDDLIASAGHVRDDDPDTWPCYRHPERDTALACVSCERPICTDCAVTAAVGQKCPECARQSPAARGRVPRQRFTRGLVAGAAAAGVAGWLYAALQIPFLGLIVAGLIGIAIGEIVRRASGGFRDAALARAAAVCAFVGLTWPAGLSLLSGAQFGSWAVYSLLAGAIAAWLAYSRAA